MLGDGVQVFQCELALVQLPVGENVVDQPVHHPLNPGWGRVRQGPACSLHYVGQHDQPRFLRLRFGTGVAVVVHVDGWKIGTLRALGLFPRFDSLVVKKGDEALSMVLADDVGDASTESVLTSQLDSVFHMGNENQTAHGRS